MAEIKEGREVTGESLVVLEQVFGDLSEGHDYIMRAVEVMSMLLGNEEIEENTGHPMEDVEQDELEMSKREAVGDYVSWNSSGGIARGRIVEIKTEGSINVPNSDFSITAEEGDPAVLIRVYREVEGGWKATDTLVGHKMSELRAIDPLPEPKEDNANVLEITDVPGQGAKIVGDFPSVLNFLPDNMPRSMSLRLARAKRNNIK